MKVAIFKPRLDCMFKEGPVPEKVGPTPPHRKPFENFVNPASVTWQKPETKYWKEKLKSLIQDHLKETESVVAKKILDDFENEIINFKQVCPVEMLDKLENPITLKDSISKAV